MTALLSRNPSSAGPPEGNWGPQVAVGGLALVATDVAGAIASISAAALELRGVDRRRGEHVHLASAQTVALADVDPGFARAVDSGWVLPDGKPITWVSALRRDRPRLRQTRGIEVLTGTIDAGRRHDLRHFLLGSTPDTLERMERTLTSRFPGAIIAGTISPPFRPPTADELVERDAAIRASGADIVWVGLGTPKQDLEALRLAGTVAAVAIAVGAAFDFAAGTLRVAPRWMSKVGLEWLFRFMSEPRRLWRRYTIDNARFVRAALRHGAQPRGLHRS